MKTIIDIIIPELLGKKIKSTGKYTFTKLDFIDYEK